MATPNDRSANLLDRRLDSKGLRPRVAASVIAILWLIAIFAFGLVMHLLDRETFKSFGEGAWWATQTVTTVGYGDIVPEDTLGRFVASILMIGGLSFFAVITGWITTEFVARSQAMGHEDVKQELESQLSAMQADLTAIREQLAALSPAPGRAAPAPPVAPEDQPPPAG
mgnify:CR=1 FL=1